MPPAAKGTTMSKKLESETPVAAATACSVVVTRYPTGCLGLDYQGSPFFWWCFDLKEMLAKIDSLGIKRSCVKWQERYYHNGRYLVPSDYRLRPWNPRNETSAGTASK
jgi:Leu/Phe-tRNA-protein transferase